MSNEKHQPKKSLADRAKEFVQDILQALDDLVPRPQPELIPIPAERPRRRR